MDTDHDDIDFKRLRDSLRDHFGAAMMYFPMAVMDMAKVDKASEEELIKIAADNGYDLRDFLRR